MHLHFHRIIIEFSLTALRDVLSSPEFYPQYHNLFDDLQYMLKCIDYQCFCHVSPSENQVSESIAWSVIRDNISIVCGKMVRCGSPQSLRTMPWICSKTAMDLCFYPSLGSLTIYFLFSLMLSSFQSGFIFLLQGSVLLPPL